MTKPAQQPEPRRQQGQPGSPQRSSHNDAAARQPAAAPQSMIINDLYPAPPAGQQMIVNDMDIAAGRGAGQQMIVNDPRHVQQQAPPQQMIVNDMAFTDLVKGLEALSKGEVPANNQMIINDLTPAHQPAARPVPQPQPRQVNAPAAQTQQLRQHPGTHAVQGQHHTQQMPVQQRVQQAPAPQQVQPQRQYIQPGPAQAPPAQNPMPRQAGAVDPRLTRQVAQPQPMVINTPQPLVKPRREDAASHHEQAPGTASRLMQEAAARQPGAASMLAENQLAASNRGGRKMPTPAKKLQSRHDTSSARGDNQEEWKGSYSGRTMTPSLVLCIGLTVLSGWFTIRFVPMAFWLEFLAASLGAIWVLQLVRWGYRVMGFRYRLTPEHLHLHRGLLYGRPVQVPRCQIIKVSVSANLLEKMLGVGKVVVQVKDGNPATVELEGVHKPKEVMQMLDPRHARAG